MTSTSSNPRLEICRLRVVTEEDQDPKPAASGTDDSSPAETTETPLADSDDSSGIMSAGSKLVTEPPSMGGTLTANSHEEKLDPVTDPFSLPDSDQPELLERKNDTLPVASLPEPSTEEPADTVSSSQPDASSAASSPVPEPSPAPSADSQNDAQDASSDEAADATDQSLSELEESAKSPAAEPVDLDSVREDVDKALTTSAATANESPEPIDALNAQPLGDDLHPSEAASSAQPDPALSAPAPGSDSAPADDPSPSTGSDVKVDDPNAPPPVPPPIPFQFGPPPTSPPASQ